MRTPEKIRDIINNAGYEGKSFPVKIKREVLMIEIMCNIAITLDKLYKYKKEINNE